MKVVTLNATYVIDLEHMKVLRLPDKNAQGALEMRRDAEEVTLYEVPTPIIGERMEMLIQVREDGLPTLRSTSQVTEIQP
jgi:hypothetical protein